MKLAASAVGLLAAAAKVSSVLRQSIEGSINVPALALMADFEIHDFCFVLSKLQPTLSGALPLNLPGASLIDTDHLSYSRWLHLHIFPPGIGGE